VATVVATGYLLVACLRWPSVYCAIPINFYDFFAVNLSFVLLIVTFIGEMALLVASVATIFLFVLLDARVATF